MTGLWDSSRSWPVYRATWRASPSAATRPRKCASTLDRSVQSLAMLPKFVATVSGIVAATVAVATAPWIKYNQSSQQLCKFQLITTAEIVNILTLYRQGYSHNNSINLGTNSFFVVPRPIFSVELIFAWAIFVSCIFNEIICIFAKNSNFSYFPA